MGAVHAISCTCGKVEMELVGEPITCAVCYCDTCREGWHRIESMTNTGPIVGADGGTGYVLYRKDRVKYSKGVELLAGYKVDDKSTTNRVVSSCCNSAMLMRFDDAKHWVCIYRGRFQDNAPALQWRICTKYKPDGVEIPHDVPAAAMFPAGFLIKLLGSKLSMVIDR